MLALIAGTGALPRAVASACDTPPLVCSLSGFAPDGLEIDIIFRLEQLGSLLSDLKDRGVTQICFAGAIKRPPIDPSQIDAATMPLVPILAQAIMAGDDSALRAVIGIFENAGFDVRAAQDVAPDLLPPAGCPTTAQPGKNDQTDARRGAQIVGAMGAADVGQSCAVLAGQPLAIEGIFGTDWMLQSLDRRPDGTGGVLFKAPKAGQDRRADLPTIGPATVSGAVAAGLLGIVIEHDGVIVLDQPEVIAACDAAGLFLWVRDGSA